MDWNAIAEALEAAARSVGLNAMDYVPDSLPNTGFYVGEMDIQPNQTMGSRTGTRRGTDQGTITCRVLVARSTDAAALRKCRKYTAGRGEFSLVQAIQADKTLDGTVDGNKVTAIRTNRLFDIGGAKFYGSEIDVFVIGAA
jgi:hypothetical protein